MSMEIPVDGVQSCVQGLDFKCAFSVRYRRGAPATQATEPRHHYETPWCIIRYTNDLSYRKYATSCFSATNGTPACHQTRNAKSGRYRVAA